MENKDSNKLCENAESQENPKMSRSQDRFGKAIEKYINLLNSQMDSFSKEAKSKENTQVIDDKVN